MLFLSGLLITRQIAGLRDNELGTRALERVNSRSLSLMSLVVSRISIMDALQYIMTQHENTEQEHFETYVVSTSSAVSRMLFVRRNNPIVLLTSLLCNGQTRRLPSAFQSLTGLSSFSVDFADHVGKHPGFHLAIRYLSVQK